MTSFGSDLENWMKNLPDEIRSMPIINLAIPGILALMLTYGKMLFYSSKKNSVIKLFSGSHDSMSYGISKSRSSVAPDALPVVDGLYKVMPCVIRRWAITQKLTTAQQLNSGIRYNFSMAVHLDYLNFLFQIL